MSYKELLPTIEGVKFFLRRKGSKYYVEAVSAGKTYSELRKIIAGIFPLAYGTSGGIGRTVARINPEPRDYESSMQLNWGFDKRNWPTYTVDENGVGIR